MKKLLALLLSVTMVLTMVSTMAFAEDKTILKFANHQVLEGGAKAFWEQFEIDFEAANPSIDLQYISAPYGEIRSTVINSATGNDAADLMLGEVDWTSEMEGIGLAVPVEDIFDEEYINDFFPNVLAAHSVNGEVYSLPLYISPFVLYYNKALLSEVGYDAPPTTYDEMLVIAEKINALSTDDNKIYAFGQTTASVPVSGMSLAAMVYNFGGRTLTDDGKLATDSEEFKAAYEMLSQLDDLGYNPQNAKLKDLRNLFATEKLAMYYDQSWGFSGVLAQNPDAINYARTAAPLKGGVNGTGESIENAHCLIFLNTDKKDAINSMVKMLLTEETIGEFMTSVHPAYPAKQAMANMEALGQSEVLKGAADSLDCIQNYPSIPDLPSFSLELCAMAQAMTIEDVDFETAYADFVEAASEFVEE